MNNLKTYKELNEAFLSSKYDDMAIKIYDAIKNLPNADVRSGDYGFYINLNQKKVSNPDDPYGEDDWNGNPIRIYTSSSMGNNPLIRDYDVQIDGEHFNCSWLWKKRIYILMRKKYNNIENEREIIRKNEYDSRLRDKLKNL